MSTDKKVNTSIKDIPIIMVAVADGILADIQSCISFVGKHIDLIAMVQQAPPARVKHQIAGVTCFFSVLNHHLSCVLGYCYPRRKNVDIKELKYCR